MDKYDKEIAELTANPNEIYMHWVCASPLFQFATRRSLGSLIGCGCLTQVRSLAFEAETPELTASVRADKRIPKYAQDISVEDLPVFAEWQRRLDKELKR